jgi:ABC-type lipoprotein export system ATPase subunit
MSTAAGSALVLADDVSRTFGSGHAAVVAVHGTSCRIEPGEQVALTGPSGSGKTTLLHLLAGLDQPTTGTVSWPALGSREDLRPGPVAVVFQTPSLLPPLTVVENVELPALLQGEPPEVARARAVESLVVLGLADLASKLPEELSGGQAQRIAVARAMAGRPALVLADEPTGQLDRASAAGVVDALIDLASHLGCGLLVNTHDESVSRRLPVQWRMTDGRLEARTDTSHQTGAIA